LSTPGAAWRQIVLTQPPGLTVPTFVVEQLPYGFGTTYVQNGSYPAASLYAGMQVFGDPPSFSVGRLDGQASSIDGWLGFAPGTTAYGAGAGLTWGVAGKFIGASSSAVTALLVNLQATAADVHSGVFVFPSGEKIAMNAWIVRRNCRMEPTEIVGDPNGPQGSGSNWSLAYWAVVRDNGIAAWM
jgi:hypothetical protein